MTEQRIISNDKLDEISNKIGEALYNNEAVSCDHDYEVNATTALKNLGKENLDMSFFSSYKREETQEDMKILYMGIGIHIQDGWLHDNLQKDSGRHMAKTLCQITELPIPPTIDECVERKIDDFSFKKQFDNGLTVRVKPSFDENEGKDTIKLCFYSSEADSSSYSSYEECFSIILLRDDFLKLSQKS